MKNPADYFLKMFKASIYECKNDECHNIRRRGSAYCQECSDKHNNKIKHDKNVSTTQDIKKES